MFVDLDWPLNASSLLSASAELLVCFRCEFCMQCVRYSYHRRYQYTGVIHQKYAFRYRAAAASAGRHGDGVTWASSSAWRLVVDVDVQQASSGVIVVPAVLSSALAAAQWPSPRRTWSACVRRHVHAESHATWLCQWRHFAPERGKTDRLLVQSFYIGCGRDAVCLYIFYPGLILVLT